MIVGAVVENLAEVLEPSLVDHGAMCEDEGSLELFFLHHLKGGERLAKSHLGIPQHLVATSELLARLLYGVSLLGTEHDGILRVGDLALRDAVQPFLYRMDGFLHGLEVAAIPLVCALHTLECLLLHPRALQHIVYLLVVEGKYHAASHEDGDFGVKQLIGYACCLGVLLNALVGSLLQSLAVAKQIASVVVGQGSLANLHAVFVPFVVDGEDINEFRFE